MSGRVVDGLFQPRGRHGLHLAIESWSVAELVVHRGAHVQLGQTAARKGPGARDKAALCEERARLHVSRGPANPLRKGGEACRGARVKVRLWRECARVALGGAEQRVEGGRDTRRGQRDAERLSGNGPVHNGAKGAINDARCAAERGGRKGAVRHREARGNGGSGGSGSADATRGCRHVASMRKPQQRDLSRELRLAHCGCARRVVALSRELRLAHCGCARRVVESGEDRCELRTKGFLFGRHCAGAYEKTLVKPAAAACRRPTRRPARPLCVFRLVVKVSFSHCVSSRRGLAKSQIPCLLS